MTWSNRYIGIPELDLGRTRAGCDCWGLVRVVFAAELGIDLPSYTGAYASATESAEIAELVEGERQSGVWARIDGPAAAFDLVLFRSGRYRQHIGVAIRDGLMLHMSGQARVEDWRQPQWEPRFIGAFRHVELTFKGSLGIRCPI